jgi:hypothetical protein
MIRDNGDALEAIALMVAGFGLTVLIALAVDKIENIFNKIKGRS